MSLAILNEEVEHESWFSEFLGEGPSGHFMRRGEISPFVSKFLRQVRVQGNTSIIGRRTLKA